jgi:type 1 glutamine amidotransferase
MRIALSVAALIAFAVTMSAARAADDLRPFHVPDREFAPVEPAAWVRDGAVKVFLSIDDLQTVDEVAALGVTIVHSGGPWPYYPLRRDDPNSGLAAEEAAKLRAFVARAKSHDMRVLVGIMPLAPVEIAKQHPDWVLHPTDEAKHREVLTQVDLTHPDHWFKRAVALNSPYGDYLIECLAEMMTDYGLDGYSFDGNYHLVLNYSPHERELYKKETGRDLPRAVDLNSVEYRLYLLWADGKLEDWYRKLHRRLREVNPEAAVYTWTTNAGRYGHFLTSPRVMSVRMNRLFDAPVQEWWLDEVNLGASVVPLFGAAYVRAAGNGVGSSEPYVMSRGNPYSNESFPKHELVTRCMGVMTNGSFAPLALAAGKDATYEALRQIQRRKPWVTRTEPMPWAALLVSEQTRQFYAHNQVMERFLAHALGVFRAAFEEHLPLNLITERDLTPATLAKYKVLVLANAACLSDEQVQTVRDYVANGGGLVATCETSMFDEIGRPRPDFTLGDVFGVSYLGRPKAPDVRPTLDANFSVVVDDTYWAQRQGVAALRWGAGDILAGDLVDDPRLAAVVRNVQATFKGPLVKISEPRAPMRRAMIMFPDAGADHMPAAATGTFGKGRVVYLAAGLDAANFSYGYPYTRILLARAMRWSAGGEALPVEVRAPMCVQSTFWEQRDDKGRRVIIHLFNNLNTTSDHGLPENDVPLREEAVPIAGIRVSLNGLDVARVHLEPEGTELDVREGEGGRFVEVPPLEIHSMVVVEVRG